MQVQDLQRATFLNQGRIFVSQDIWKCRIWPKAYFWALTAACFDSFQSLSPTYHSPTIHPLTFSKELLWDACNRNPENKCNSTLIFLTEGRGEIEACTFSFSILFFFPVQTPTKIIPIHKRIYLLHFTHSLKKLLQRSEDVFI